MAKLLIKNGRIIDPASKYDGVADLLVEDGRIAAIGANLSASGAEILDAEGMIVAPGFLDIHVHLREPGFEHAETIETGARAAAAGGFPVGPDEKFSRGDGDSSIMTVSGIMPSRHATIPGVPPPHP